MSRLEICGVVLGIVSGFAWFAYAFLEPDLSAVEFNSSVSHALQALYLVAVIICFRDIYLRRSVGIHTKLVWGAVIILLNSIGLWAYLQKFGAKNRSVELVT
jgi:hypothetical protein